MPLAQRTSFPKALVASLVLVSLLALILFSLVFTSTEADKDAYKNLIDDGQASAMSSQKGIHQHRFATQRDLVFSDGSTRLRMRLWSKQGELVFQQQHGEQELVENMEDVHCIIQERLFEKEGRPFQEIRVITANKAVYSYEQEQLTAKDVYIQHFVIPGHALVENLDGYTPTMRGKAAIAEFFLGGEQIRVQLQQFKARIEP